MRCLFRYPGAKGNLRHQIVELLPPHRTYCEPFGGSAAVLIAKPPSPVEWYNDTDRIVVDLFRLLREGGPELDRLIDAVSLTPYARDELALARANIESPDRVERLRAFLFRCWASKGAGHKVPGIPI